MTNHCLQIFDRMIKNELSIEISDEILEVRSGAPFHHILLHKFWIYRSMSSEIYPELSHFA